MNQNYNILKGNSYFWNSVSNRTWAADFEVRRNLNGINMDELLSPRSYSELDENNSSRNLGHGDTACMCYDDCWIHSLEEMFANSETENGANNYPEEEDFVMDENLLDYEFSENDKRDEIDENDASEGNDDNDRQNEIDEVEQIIQNYENEKVESEKRKNSVDNEQTKRNEEEIEVVYEKKSAELLMEEKRKNAKIQYEYLLAGILRMHENYKDDFSLQLSFYNRFIKLDPKVQKLVMKREL